MKIIAASPSPPPRKQTVALQRENGQAVLNNRESRQQYREIVGHLNKPARESFCMLASSTTLHPIQSNPTSSVRGGHSGTHKSHRQQCTAVHTILPKQASIQSIKPPGSSPSPAARIYHTMQRNYKAGNHDCGNRKHMGGYLRDNHPQKRGPPTAQRTRRPRQASADPREVRACSWCRTREQDQDQDQEGRGGR